ncbi:MAG: hypothetical protein GY809_16965 [Planctomycetes bacterium]|nr:hypothetical protein [Planctomycetota bacterium]
MNTKLTITGHLAIAVSIITLVTVVLPTFLTALMPSALGSLLVSKQMQIEWLNSMLQAMHQDQKSCRLQVFSFQ